MLCLKGQLFLFKKCGHSYLPVTLEATRKGGLLTIFCQVGKLRKRKDTHQIPVLPNLRVADVI